MTALAGVLVLGGAVAACGGGSSKGAVAPPVVSKSASPTPTPTPTALGYQPFTGGATGLTNPVLAIKIDNTAPAHPQAGLRSADVVYVEQVEGGETRVMAIFSSQLPAKIGPVRSARISDLHLLKQYGKPAFGFSGVQGKMKPYIRRAPLFPVPDDGSGGLYVRDNGRPAPYNLFVDPHRLFKKAPQATAPRDIGFRFGPAPAGGRPLASVTAKWPAESMKFAWSAKDKRYLAWHNGTPDQAAEGGQLGGQTIVIQYAKIVRSQFHDFLGSYTPLIQSTGTGRALVLRDGEAYDTTWSRPSEDRGTTFTTTGGQPMTFAKGQVWVVLVNAGKPYIP
jgi:Protein of unknown function (DUF3048) N-terminal domain/Protein of unknown function (DUF3048) C-terminal domain